MTSASPTILLLGSDAALLEGLSQSLGALGYSPKVALGIHDSREIGLGDPPLIVVAATALLVDGTAELLRIPLAPGGALVLYHTTGHPSVVLTPTVQRAVL